MIVYATLRHERTPAKGASSFRVISVPSRACVPQAASSGSSRAAALPPDSVPPRKVYCYAIESLWRYEPKGDSSAAGPFGVWGCSSKAAAAATMRTADFQSGLLMSAPRSHCRASRWPPTKKLACANPLSMKNRSGSIELRWMAFEGGQPRLLRPDPRDGPQIGHVGMYFVRGLNRRHRFISSRKARNVPTFGDYHGASMLDGGGRSLGRSRRAAVVVSIVQAIGAGRAAVLRLCAAS